MGGEPVLELMVTITDRRRGEQAASFFRQMHVPLAVSCIASGTATSEIQKLLTNNEKTKVVTMSLLPTQWIPVVISKLSDRMQLRGEGRGIAFTVPLSSVNRASVRAYTEYLERGINEEQIMYKPLDKKFEMVVVSTDDGCADAIMDAARAAGAKGGTVLNGHMVGDDKTESFFGMKLYDSKDVLAIVVPSDIRFEVMSAIAEVLKERKLKGSTLFSVPVNHIVGIGGID